MELRKRPISKVEGFNEDADERITRKVSQKNTPLNATQLRLEAIFHPKFENESSDKQIRASMIDHVAKQEGYLEVSLKHSGSLLLWSGSQRFFSKNSTDNVFTHVGEILLYQHFARAFGFDQAMDGTSIEEYIEQKYEECSSYLEQHRLTCSFELVTSMLGHHGDLPKRDYLILIAVADRKTQSFYNTVELIQFAQKFRLAHNDVWLFDSSEHCAQLFNFYDESWQSGTADMVTSFLDDISNYIIRSICPHIEFQGDILEGLVLRYVPHLYSYAGKQESIASSREQFLQQIRSLEEKSVKMLDIVPPARTLDSISLMNARRSCDEYQSKYSLLLNFDLRDVARKGDFSEAVDYVLQEVHGHCRRIIRPVSNLTIDIEAKEFNTLDMLQLSKNLQSSTTITKETKLICELIQTLHEMKAKVDYNITKENIKNSQRILCTVQINHDETFQKYDKIVRERQDFMKLFRGFTIEIVLDTSNFEACDVMLSNTQVQDSVKTIEEIQNENCPLMLKMKFLPYMVRTFICRNGLAILSKSGEDEFESFAYTQMRNWGTCNLNMDHWMPFFKGWAKYCRAPLTKTDDGLSLSTLSSGSYLHHFYEFQRQYEQRNFNLSTSIEKDVFRGLIILIGLHHSSTLRRIAESLMKVLGCMNAVEYNKNMKPHHLARQSYTGGSICYTCVTSSNNFIHTILQKDSLVKEKLYILFVGLGENDMISRFQSSDNSTEAKKTKGMLKSWRKTDCKLKFDLPSNLIHEDEYSLDSILNNRDSEAGKVIQMLKESNSSFSKGKKRGMIVFFPIIPGAGKSFFCHDANPDMFSSITERKVVCRQGDITTGKYFIELKKDVFMEPSSIFITDKNLPPSTFTHVAEICSEFNLVATAVIPDGMKDTFLRIYSMKKRMEKTVVFPFSLQYLAVCLSRVLRRDPATHPGKLDAGNELACMIVIKFFCLYRNWNVHKLRRTLSTLTKGNNLTIIVPCFVSNDTLPPLPQEVETSLIEAITVQIESEGNTASGSDVAFAKAEQRLRSCIESHMTHIDRMVIDRSISKDAFFSQLSKAVQCLEEDNFESMPSYQGHNDANVQTWSMPSYSEHSNPTIQIVSLDIDKTLIDTALEELAKKEPTVADFLLTHKNDSMGRFIAKTHCTFCHNSNADQSYMRASFSPWIGKSIEILVTDIYMTNDVVAFGVSGIDTNDPNDGSPLEVPKPHNEFPHITIWCNKGIESRSANDIPRKDHAKISISPPIKIKGIFNFWFEEHE